MRTPEHRAQPRVGKKFETELDMHYLSPGAFTVLPLDVNRLPDPPPAPPPYRLPTTTRRFKHPSFAIIGEATSSSPNSRSSSPTGRVSPFRGRGFNATGSRHVSPSTSPIPPEDPRTRSPSPTKTASSKIPKPRKSSTAAVFGEKVNHVEFQGLSRQGSQSLSSLEERQPRRKPPPSPQKKLKGAAAFKQLSPIQGSSPEPSQSQSSPSRIPTKSQSTPPSRYASPTREPKAKRSRSRPSVVKSRDPSPLASPAKIPVNRYQHVQSKINTFNKPKLPAKPQLSSDVSEDSGSPKKKVHPRKNSFNRTPSRPNLLPKTYMGKHSNYTSDSSDAVDVNTPPVRPSAVKAPAVKPAAAAAKAAAAAAATKVLPAPNASNSPTKSKAPPRAKGHIAQKVAVTPAKTGSNRRPSKSSTEDTSAPEESAKSAPLADLEDDEDAAPSALGVVSSTTNTVATPLKIETPKLGRSKPMSPMIDGRVLSATSVSQAINKMNDTVLNTQTLIKDSGLQNRGLPPAASAIIALKSDSSAKDSESSEKPTVNSRPAATTIASDDTPTPTTTTTTTTATNADQATKTTSNSDQPGKIADYSQSKPTINNNHSNHVTTIGLGNAKAIEREVQNNMNRLLGSIDSSLDGVPASKMSVNDRIREARTVIAADVKPIRITVREKPSDVDVQSGNVGPHFGIANGVNERPSLPPSQQQPPQPEDASAKEERSPNRCKRFFNSCTKALTCGSCLTLGCQACQRFKSTSKHEEETEAPHGCFKSLTNKLTKEAKEQVRINIEDENGQTESRSLWQKICCRQAKVGDSSGCFPKFGKSKERVSVRGTSFLQSEVQGRTKCCSKESCRTFFRKIFCSGCCKKNEEPQPVGARKESMISSKKKSLTPTSVPPPEEIKPKIDASLVEHTSHMKGAIPVLPIWLAWFCCIMNCIGPGTGTILSGMFCLCIGKPRFSQKDGPKPRIGAFIIDLIIGFSQFFTVLFCLVGWGWSIWWGVIMVKIARKHKKFKHLEMLEEAAGKPQPLAGHQKRDVERHRP